MRKSSVMLTVLVFVAMSYTATAQIAVLDFASGAFPASVVVNNNEQGKSCDDSGPVGAGCGDVAIKTDGNYYASISPQASNGQDTQHDYSWHTDLDLARGNNLNVVFQTWIEDGTGGWAGFPTNSGVQGPWINDGLPNIPENGFTSGTGEGGGIQAGLQWVGLDKFQVAGWNTGNTVNGMPAWEAFKASRNRGNSVWFQVWLGNTTGGALAGSTSADGAGMVMWEDRRDEVGLNNAATVEVGFSMHASGCSQDNVIIQDDQNFIPIEISAYELD